jgi:hypothetical protein
LSEPRTIFSGVALLPPQTGEGKANSIFMLIDINCLAEADRHVFDAHHRIAHQKQYIAELSADRRSVHAASALLALMNLMLPITENLRQQILASMTSNKEPHDKCAATRRCSQLILQITKLSENSHD